ncbi:MAG: lysophospholipid acyltransferase family protein [Myxococcales bacterium]|jgi:KDO2-lipid IV(A) lauroyltransferase
MGLLLFVLHRLPKRLAEALMRALAWLAWALGVRRAVARQSLAIAFPDMPEAKRRELARRNYLHLGTCAADFLRSPALKDEELRALVDPGDWAKVEPYLREKKGFIVATAHFGNFELFGVYAARRGVPLAILTRVLKGAANARWVRTRALAGIREIHRGWDNLFKSVESGEALALLIDQNMLLKRAVFVPFFGRIAATTPAPAVVAEKTGAPVFLALMPRKDDGTYRVVIDGPFHFEGRSDDRQQDIVAFTAMLNDRLEARIREHPEQWFWLHRRWKTRPPEEAAAAAAG